MNRHTKFDKNVFQLVALLISDANWMAERRRKNRHTHTHTQHTISEHTTSVYVLINCQLILLTLMWFNELECCFFVFARYAESVTHTLARCRYSGKPSTSLFKHFTRTVHLSAEFHTYTRAHVVARKSFSTTQISSSSSASHNHKIRAK